MGRDSDHLVAGSYSLGSLIFIVVIGKESDVILCQDKPGNGFRTVSVRGIGGWYRV